MEPFTKEFLANMSPADAIDLILNASCISFDNIYLVTCPECGTAFLVRGTKQRYCQPRCYELARRKTTATRARKGLDTTRIRRYDELPSIRALGSASPLQILNFVNNNKELIKKEMSELYDK